MEGDDERIRMREIQKEGGRAGGRKKVREGERERDAN